MLKVGITGGIGAGKTLVCQVFETLGIPVFYADTVAKQLMETDAKLVAGIQKLFGDKIYNEGKLNRAELSAIVFQDPSMLDKLNALVHPAVIEYGRKWMNEQKTPYVIKEAAIFFESGSNKDMDLMVGVYAPKDLRTLRAMQRDSVAADKVLERMSAQMNEDEKMDKCDYVITNDGVEAIIPQVLDMHKYLTSLARTKA